MSLEPLRSGQVVFGLIGLGVRVAIDFDAELGVGSIEVGDEAAEENMLAADVESEMVIPQLPPQTLFRRSERMTQVARALQDGWRDPAELRNCFSARHRFPHGCAQTESTSSLPLQGGGLGWGSRISQALPCLTPAGDVPPAFRDSRSGFDRTRGSSVAMRSGSPPSNDCRPSGRCRARRCAGGL